MKNSFLLFTAIFIYHMTFSQTDCAKLYVKEHLLGSPICNLSEGDYIEICEDLNEVNGCPRNFYIYDKGFSSGSLTYELSLDRGWSTHYMTLMVNPSTKRFGFIIQGQTALYSYYTETELAVKRQNEAKQKRIEDEIRAREAENRKQEKEKQDIETINQINSLINKNDIKSAKNLVKKLNFNHPEIDKKIEIYLKALDQQVTEEIQEYLNQHNVEKAAEFYERLNYPNHDIRAKIHTALSEKYWGIQINNDDYEMSQNFIKLNNNTLSTLNPGIYKIIVSKSGEAKIENDKDLKLEFYDVYKLKYHKIFGFEIPTAGNVFCINIKQNEPVLLSTNYYCRSAKIVFKTAENKYYYKSLNTTYSVLVSEIDKTLEKNTIKIVKKYKIETLANDIPIKESYSEETKIEPILKKE